MFSLFELFLLLHFFQLFWTFFHDFCYGEKHSQMTKKRNWCLYTTLVNLFTFIISIHTMTETESKTQTYFTTELASLNRVKRFGNKGGGGGGGGCNCGGGGGGFGTKVTMTRASGSGGGGGKDQTLKILLGVKAIVLKGILLKSILQQKNSSSPPIITSVNATATTAAAG